MIVQERIENTNLIHTYSNTGMKLIQHPTELEYDEAIDIETAPYTYTESENALEEEIDAEEALSILLGK